MSMFEPTPRTYNLALIGFGGVNRALAALVRDRGAELEKQLGFSLRIVAITDLRHGSWLDPGGIDPAVAVSVPPRESFPHGGSACANNKCVIQNCDADIVVEATFTDPADGEPATSHVRWALQAGKHVVTTNKGPVALHRDELLDLAAENSVCFAYEGAVMSGTPVLRFADQNLRGLEVASFEGVFNGTSNFVLGRMKQGRTLPQAVAEAQHLGYAEADPSADISGSDVRLKTVILANHVLGGKLTVADVSMTGIGDLTGADIADAARNARVWKLIGSAARATDGTVTGSVKPVALPLNHPLAGVSGATNAVSFSTDLLGTLTLSGPGAGRVETAYSLLADVIAIDDFDSKRVSSHV